MEGYQKIFIYAVNILIDEGERETVSTIEQHCNDKNIYGYLIERYPTSRASEVLQEHRDLYEKKINDYMAQWVVDLAYNALRKYGISEKGGLPMLVNAVVNSL